MFPIVDMYIISREGHVMISGFIFRGSWVIWLAAFPGPCGWYGDGPVLSKRDCAEGARDGTIQQTLKCVYTHSDISTDVLRQIEKVLEESIVMHVLATVLDDGFMGRFKHTLLTIVAQSLNFLFFLNVLPKDVFSLWWQWSVAIHGSYGRAIGGKKSSRQSVPPALWPWMSICRPDVGPCGRRVHGWPVMGNDSVTGRPLLLRSVPGEVLLGVAFFVELQVGPLPSYPISWFIPNTDVSLFPFVLSSSVLNYTSVLTNSPIQAHLGRF